MNDANENNVELKVILGKRIKEARIAKGLTQPELAKIINSTDRNISNYETGYSYPSIKVLYSLSKGLSTSIDYLFGLTDNPVISTNKHDIELSKEDYRLLDQLKRDEDLYHFLSQNPEKGIYYIYKIWKLMEEWKM